MSLGVVLDFNRDIRRWGSRFGICPSVLERKLFKNNHLKMGISARGGLNPISGFCFPRFSMALPREIAISVENSGM